MAYIFKDACKIAKITMSCRLVVMTIVIKAYKPVSSSHLWHPYSFRFYDYFIESAVVFRSPSEKIIDPFLSQKLIDIRYNFVALIIELNFPSMIVTFQCFILSYITIVVK